MSALALQYVQAERAPAQPAEDPINGRLREVLARPITTTLLYELYLESPRGACVACWRDLGWNAGPGPHDEGHYFCTRGRYQRCQQLRSRIVKCMVRAQQAAKGFPLQAAPKGRGA